MELKEFISNTIKEITDGIIEGNEYVKGKVSNSGIYDNEYITINFDMAVTTNDEAISKKGGKISVVKMLDLGATSENQNKHLIENRIKFDLQLYIKTGTYNKPKLPNI
nr:hypothetical protein [uncultured Carboxylicivirga sp.]